MYTGEVVRIGNDQLIVADQYGKQRTHTIASDAIVTCDGVVCTVMDLGPGMRIRISTKEYARDVAVRIEAIDRHEKFEKRK